MTKRPPAPPPKTPREERKRDVDEEYLEKLKAIEQAKQKIRESNPD